MGLSSGPIRKANAAPFNTQRGGPDSKWAYLFKRPVRTKLFEVKNKKWVSRIDPGGSPSYRGWSNSEANGSTPRDKGRTHLIADPLFEHRDGGVG